MDHQENTQEQQEQSTPQIPALQSDEAHTSSKSKADPSVTYVYQSSVQPKNGKATASLILGIISLVFIFLGYGAIIGIVLAIIGTVLAVMARKEIRLNGESNMSTANAGLVCSLISLITTSVVFIGCMVCTLAIAGAGVYSNLTVL